MNHPLLRAQQWVGVHWHSVRTWQLPRDDRGAVTTETAIITAVIAVAALVFAGVIATVVIPNFTNEIPTNSNDPGGAGGG